jgi:hypothetical protein
LYCIFWMKNVGTAAVNLCQKFMEYGSAFYGLLC